MDSKFKFTTKTKFGAAKAANAFVQGIDNLSDANFRMGTVYDVNNIMLYTGDKVVDAEKASGKSLSPAQQFHIGEARDNNGKKVTGIYSVNPDTNLCWAATAANMLVRGNWADSVLTKTGVNATDYVLNTFRHGFRANTEAGSEIGIAGGSIENALQWFFSGKVSSDFKVDHREGGYYPKVNCSVTYQDINEVNGKQMIKNIDQRMKKGETIGASVFMVEGNQLSGGHAVTVCGFVYDDTKKNKPDYYAGIILTDSDDAISTDPTSAPNTLKVQQLKWDARIDAYRLTDYANGTYILAAFTALAPNSKGVAGQKETKPLYYQAPVDANWWLPGSSSAPARTGALATPEHPTAATVAAVATGGPVEEIAPGERYVAQAGELWSNTAVFGNLQLSARATLEDGYIGVGGVVKAAGNSRFDGLLRVAGQLVVSGALRADNSLQELYDQANELDLLVMMQTPGNAAPLVKNFDRIQGAFDLTVTITAAQANGRYSLADGAAKFDGTVEVYSSPTDTETFREDTRIGYLSAGSTLIVNGKEYRLNLEKPTKTLSFTVDDSTEVGTTVYRNLYLQATAAQFESGSRAEFLTVGADTYLTVAAGATISDVKVKDWGTLVLDGESDGILNVESFAEVTINANARLSGMVTVAGMLEIAGAVEATGAAIYLNLRGGFGDLDAYVENIDLLNGATFHVLTADRPANGTFLIGRGDALAENFAVEVNWGGKLTINDAPVTVGNKSYALYGDDDALVMVIADATKRAPGAAHVALRRVDADIQVATIRYHAGSSRNEYAVNDGKFELYYDAVVTAATDCLGTRSANEHGGVETWRRNVALAAQGTLRQTGGALIVAPRSYRTATLDDVTVSGGLHQFEAFGGAWHGTLAAEEHYDADRLTTTYRYRNTNQLKAAGSLRVTNVAIEGGISGYTTLRAAGGTLSGDLRLNCSDAVAAAPHLALQEELQLLYTPVRNTDFGGQFSRVETAGLRNEHAEAVWTRTISETHQATGSAELTNVAFADAIRGFANVAIRNATANPLPMGDITGGRFSSQYEQEAGSGGNEWTYAETTRTTGKLQLWNVASIGNVTGFATLRLDGATLRTVDGYQRKYAAASDGSTWATQWTDGSADVKNSAIATLSGYRNVTLQHSEVATLAGGRTEQADGALVTSNEGHVKLNGENAVGDLTGYSALTLANRNRIQGEHFTVGKVTLQRGARLEASREVVDALWGLQKSFQMAATAQLYDIGVSVVAKNFTTVTREQADNTLTSDVQLTDGAQGWLCNQLDSEQALAYQDGTDLFRLATGCDLSGWMVRGADAALSVRVFQLTAAGWDAGTVVAGQNGVWDLSAVALAAAADYRIAVAIDETRRGVFGYELSHAQIAG